MTNLPEFKKASVLVVGDVMLDRYWKGATERISPEAPVPVVRKKDTEDRLGGAANVAMNLSRLGVNVTLCGLTGQDTEGKLIANLVTAAGINAKLVTSPDFKTITKLRVLSRNQQLLRIDTEQSAPLATAQSVNTQAESLLGSCDVLIVSDYGKGSFDRPKELISKARELGVKVLVDPKGTEFERYANATLITPNLSEFKAVVGTCASDTEIMQKAASMRERLKLKALIVTLSERGIAIIEENNDPVILPAQSREVFDVTGAGDTVIATLGGALAADCSIIEAAKLANTAASIVVNKLGTASVSPQELINAQPGKKDQLAQCIQGEDALLDIVRAAQSKGEKIVMTNGCFDLLHPGHIDYLQKASALADKFIIAVNTDNSVARLKGNSRPINSLNDRMSMLAAIKGVDWVCTFDEDTPARLIGKLLPDILVKGGDYRVDQIAGAREVIENGGEVKVLDFLDGYSSTGIIERIKQTS